METFPPEIIDNIVQSIERVKDVLTFRVTCNAIRLVTDDHLKTQFTRFHRDIAEFNFCELVDAASKRGPKSITLTAASLKEFSSDLPDKDIRFSTKSLSEEFECWTSAKTEIGEYVSKEPSLNSDMMCYSQCSNKVSCANHVKGNIEFLRHLVYKNIGKLCCRLPSIVLPDGSVEFASSVTTLPTFVIESHQKADPSKSTDPMFIPHASFVSFRIFYTTEYPDTDPNRSTFDLYERPLMHSPKLVQRIYQYLGVDASPRFKKMVWYLNDKFDATHVQD
jgi:hypothetical protein